jgi:hypothetical protein
MKKCSVADCEGSSYCKGYCMKHYYRMKRHGTTDYPRMYREVSCAFDGCTKLAKTKNLCRTHYVKFNRTGTIKPLRRANGSPEVKLAARERTKQWKAKNWDSYKAYLASRKSRVKQATPKWVSLNEIRTIYANRPDGFHVDHIIPINGQIVSGLHVPWNLQYLPATENMSKGRRVF